MLRVCVIGLGAIGNLHSNIYKSDNLVELVGVCDRIESRAKIAGERLGVPYYLDAQEMLKELKPDLCSIATGGWEYGSDHYLATMQALNAGCHVLCEKPICNELKPAEEMVSLAKEKGLCLGVDFNHRFTPAAILAKKWLDEGKMGNLLFVNMALWIGKFGEFETPNYHLKALNPHSVDMMRYYCGEVEKVQCFALKAPGRNIWSSASINMQFKNGMVGHLTSSYDIKRGHPMERCEVAGTEARFVVDDMWREATLYPAGKMEKTVYTNPVFGGYEGFDDTFRARIHHFALQVSEGVKPEDINGSGRDALAGLRVILAAIESLDTGKIVVIK